MIWCDNNAAYNAAEHFRKKQSLLRTDKISMTSNFCLYTVQLVRPAQAKIQMMTTSNWIVTIPSKSFLKSLGLYKFFLDDQNYFLMLEIKLKIKFLEIFSTCQDISPGDKILHMQVRKAKVM